MPGPSKNQVESLLMLLRSGRMTEAENACTELLRSHPQSALIHNIHGAVLRGQGRFDEATKSIRRAIQLDPGYVEAYNNLGNMLSDLGHLEEAVEAYNEAIRLRPDYAIAYANRADTLSDLGQIEQALEDYDKAIELKPDHVAAWTHRGNALADLGRPEEAVESYDEALRLMPGNATAHCNRGIALAAMDRVDEAAASFTRALELDPDDTQLGARLHLARLRGEALPERTPEPYLINLYRSRAGAWDKITQLRYNGHDLVTGAIEHVAGVGQRLAVLDLGCGTGSLGNFLRRYSNFLAGVDMSPDMLEQARSKEIYDELVEAELVQHLGATGRRYDLIVAAAVLIHFADLSTVFSLVHERLNDNGLFVFSTFLSKKEDIELTPSNMYAHSKESVRALIDRTGFQMVHENQGVHERHGINEVEGIVYAVKKPAGARPA